MLRSSFLAVAALSLAACTTPAAAPAPVAAPAPEPTPAPPCCSADELVAFAAAGTADEDVIAAIRDGRGAVLPILEEAGVSKEVVDAWLNPPPEPKPKPVARKAPAPAPEPKAAPVPLKLAMKYKAGKSSYTLTNTGDTNLSGLKITINGSYRYELPVVLAPGASDNILLTSHKASGERLAPPVPPPGYKYPHIERIAVRGDQGNWSQTL